MSRLWTPAERLQRLHAVRQQERGIRTIRREVTQLQRRPGLEVSLDAFAKAKHMHPRARADAVFSYDYDVDPLWTGPQGQEFPTLTGHTFRVFTLLDLAVADAVATGASRAILYRGGTTEDVTVGATAGTILIEGLARGVGGAGAAGLPALTGDFLYNALANQLILRNFTVTGTFDTSGTAPRLTTDNLDIGGVTTFGAAAFDHTHWNTSFGDDINFGSSSPGGRYHFFGCRAEADIAETGTVLGEFIWRGGYVNGSVDLPGAVIAEIDTYFKGSGVPGYHVRIARNSERVIVRGIMEALSSASAIKDYVLITIPTATNENILIDIVPELPTNTTNEIHYVRAERTGVAGEIRGVTVRVNCGLSSGGNRLEDLAGGWASVYGRFVQSTFHLTPCTAVVETIAGSVDNCIVSGTPAAGSIGLLLSNSITRIQAHSLAVR